jgi:hypothetical protein
MDQDLVVAIRDLFARATRAELTLLRELAYVPPGLRTQQVGQFWLTWWGNAELTPKLLASLELERHSCVRASEERGNQFVEEVIGRHDNVRVIVRFGYRHTA